MRNIKITIEYDGSAYCGWQRQACGASIQKTIEAAIEKITQEKIKIVASGRTDAGVHAIGQAANFRCQTTISPKSLRNGLNSVLPADIAVTALTDVDFSFHSRRDARSKVYLYRITNGDIRPVLARAYSWHIFKKLDVAAMKNAASFLLGEHDFRSFCSTHTNVQSFVRTISDVEVKTNIGQTKIEISVEANGFLRHMVRTIVGTLVAVGRGKMPPETVTDILRAKDRELAATTAPPEGLFLKEVKY